MTHLCGLRRIGCGVSGVKRRQDEFKDCRIRAAQHRELARAEERQGTH
jgi:hypothetical protein